MDNLEEKSKNIDIIDNNENLPTEHEKIGGYSLCPNCSEVPLIYIVESLVPDKILIECQTCRKKNENNENKILENGIINKEKQKVGGKSYKKIIEIKEYLENINKIEQKSKQEAKNCQRKGCKASEGTGVSYCIQCTKWFCSKCLKKHNQINKAHNIVEEQLGVNPKCEINGHDRRDLEYYCYNCKINICQICKNGDHVTHVVKSLLDIKLSIDTSEIIKAMKEQTFQKNCIKYRDSLIRNLEEKIKQIKEAYQKNFEINKNLFKLINLLLKTYGDFIDKKGVHSYNYNILQNIIYNCHFNVSEFEISNETSSESVNKLIKYYQTNYIFGTNNVDHSKFETIKQFQEKDRKEVGFLTVLHNNNLCATYFNKIYIFNQNNFNKTRIINVSCDIRSLIQLTDHLFGVTYSKKDFDIIEIIYIEDKFEENVDENEKAESIIKIKGQPEKRIEKVILINENSFAFCNNNLINVVEYEYNNESKFILKKQINNLQNNDKNTIDNCINSIIKPKKENVLISGNIDGDVIIFSIRSLNIKFIEKNLAKCYIGLMEEIEGTNKIIVAGCKSLSVIEIIKEGTKNPNKAIKILLIEFEDSISSLLRVRQQFNGNFTLLIGTETFYYDVVGEDNQNEPINYTLLNFNDVFRLLEKKKEKKNNQKEEEKKEEEKEEEKKEEEKEENNICKKIKDIEIKGKINKELFLDQKTKRKMVSSVSWNRRCMVFGFSDGTIKFINY